MKIQLIEEGGDRDVIDNKIKMIKMVEMIEWILQPQYRKDDREDI